MKSFKDVYFPQAVLYTEVQGLVVHGSVWLLSLNEEKKEDQRE